MTEQTQRLCHTVITTSDNLLNRRNWKWNFRWVAALWERNKALTLQSPLHRLFNVASRTPKVVFLDFLESYLVRKRFIVLLKGQAKLLQYVGNTKRFTYTPYIQSIHIIIPPSFSFIELSSLPPYLIHFSHYLKVHSRVWENLWQL